MLRLALLCPIVAQYRKQTQTSGEVLEGHARKLIQENNLPLRQSIICSNRLNVSLGNILPDIEKTVCRTYLRRVRKPATLPARSGGESRRELTGRRLLQSEDEQHGLIALIA